VRFLIDEKLSPKLVAVLQSAYPDTTHVEALGLRGRLDSDVWTAAREGGFAILTKDDDFAGMSVLFRGTSESGPPEGRCAERVAAARGGGHRLGGGDHLRVVAEGDFRGGKMLIEFDLDVNPQADTGRTALHGAAHKGAPT
jgi:hypothetical protein